jgi:hypothetical protein
MLALPGAAPPGVPGAHREGEDGTRGRRGIGHRSVAADQGADTIVSMVCEGGNAAPGSMLPWQRAVGSIPIARSTDSTASSDAPLSLLPPEREAPCLQLRQDIT